MGRIIKLLKGRTFFLFVQIVYLALRGCSFNTRLRITRSLAFIVYLLWKSGRERIQRNISFIRPDLDDSQIAQGSWQVAKIIARSWAAMLGNEFTSLEEIDKRVEVEGEEQLLDYFRQGRRIIVTMDHVGPIDEILGIVPLLGLRVYIPVEPAKPEWFLNLMRRLRMCLGDIISEPVGRTLVRAARYLCDGRVLILFIDVPRQDNSGVLCRIGDAEEIFSIGAVRLALKYDAVIFPVFPSQGENLKVRVVIGPPFGLIKTGDRNRDIEVNTRRLIEGVYAPHIQDNYGSWLRLLPDTLKLAKTDGS